MIDLIQKYGYDKLECIRHDLMHSQLSVQDIMDKYKLKYSELTGYGKIFEWCYNQTMKHTINKIEVEFIPTKVLSTEQHHKWQIIQQQREQVMTISDLKNIPNQEAYLIKHFS